MDRDILAACQFQRFAIILQRFIILPQRHRRMSQVIESVGNAPDITRFAQHDQRFLEHIFGFSVVAVRPGRDAPGGIRAADAAGTAKRLPDRQRILEEGARFGIIPGGRDHQTERAHCPGHADPGIVPRKDRIRFLEVSLRVAKLAVAIVRHPQNAERLRQVQLHIQFPEHHHAFLERFPFFANLRDRAIRHRRHLRQRELAPRPQPPQDRHAVEDQRRALLGHIELFV